MKKLFSILAISGMLFFIGCNSSKTEDNGTEEATAIEQAVEEAVEGSEADATTNEAVVEEPVDEVKEDAPTE